MRGGYEVGLAAVEDGGEHLSGAETEATGMIYLMGGWLDDLIL